MPLLADCLLANASLLRSETPSSLQWPACGAGVPLTPPLVLDLHFVPRNRGLQQFGRGLAFLLLAILAITGLLAFAGGAVAPGTGGAFGGEPQCSVSDGRVAGAPSYGAGVGMWALSHRLYWRPCAFG